MKYQHVKMIFSSQKSFVEKHGEVVWEELCDACAIGEIYSVNVIAGSLPAIKHYKNPGKYLRLIIANVIAEYGSNPEEVPVRWIDESRRTHFKLI